MNNKIEKMMEEVNKYFIDRILNNDFKVQKIEAISDSTTLIAEVLIDDCLFTLWVHSYLGSRKVYCYDGKFNYITLNFKRKESSKALTIFKKIYKETVEKKVIEEELKELSRLQAKHSK